MTKGTHLLNRDRSTACTLAFYQQAPCQALPCNQYPIARKRMHHTWVPHFPRLTLVQPWKISRYQYLVGRSLFSSLLILITHALRQLLIVFFLQAFPIHLLFAVPRLLFLSFSRSVQQPEQCTNCRSHRRCYILFCLDLYHGCLDFCHGSDHKRKWWASREG